MDRFTFSSLWPRLAQAAISGAAAALVAACSSGTAQAAQANEFVNLVSAEQQTAGTTPWSAEIRRTSAGVPHIKGATLADVGYGYGYAFAEDNFCVFAEEILTVRGERAKHFGDVGYDYGVSAARSNVSSDAFYKMMATPQVANAMRNSLSPELQANVRAYAAGFSRYLKELQQSKHPGRHASCRNASWIRPITDEDIYLRVYKLTLLISSGALIDSIAASVPPAPSATASTSAALQGLPAGISKEEIEAGFHEMAPQLVAIQRGETGSNMYALGRQVTGGGGLQFANPHFPWWGPERLYQVHLTVPGKMDVQGVSLYGFPNVQIGFTQKFAWSLTVSTASRFTPYRLVLKSGDPLKYVQDGVEKNITRVAIPVLVKQADGSVITKEVSLYRSEYGPMVTLGPALGWSATQAFTIRDANTQNLRWLRQMFRSNMASSLNEFKSIQAQEVGMPWVNVTAADVTGETYYGDLTVVPNVPNTLADACKVPGYSDAVMAATRLTLLDGAKKSCAWGSDSDAPQSGIFGVKNLPKLNRSDWVLNCNDSYWLTNSRAPITGFARIIGFEATEQTLRSRLCHQQIIDRVNGKDEFTGTQFTPDNLKEIVLSSRVYTAEKMKAPLLQQVCGKSSVLLTQDPLATTAQTPPVSVQIAPACSALKAWDNRNNANSRGSIVWDQLWFRLEKMRATGVVTYAVPFDPASPVSTPRNLVVPTADLEQAFAAAVYAVQSAGFDVNAPRSAVSYREGSAGPTERIPVPGGFQRTGTFTIAQTRLRGTEVPVLKPDTGYGPLTYGNSYMQVVKLTPERVEAHTFVTYSQSTDPASPLYDNYTRLYSNKAWVKAAFTDAEIRADLKSSKRITQ